MRAVTDQRRVQLGDTDAPAEDEVVQAFDRVVSQGAQRLHRTWREVLTTGLAGGLEVAVGVLALVAVYAETGSHSLSDFLAKMPEAFIVLQCSPPNGSSGATQTSPV